MPAEVPESLADALATSTGPDGTTKIDYLAARDQLVAVRISSDSVGSQDYLLVERPGRGSEPAVITIKLKRTGTISGRIVDENSRPVPGQAVEVWSKGGGNWLLPNLVGFQEGTLRHRPDGSFQTPSKLQQGSAYRVAIRAPGTDPIFSDWITIQDRSTTLPLLVQRGIRAPSAGGWSTGRGNRSPEPAFSRQAMGRIAPRRRPTGTAVTRWAGSGTGPCFCSSAAPDFACTGN